jgi:hypothetical protein
MTMYDTAGHVQYFVGHYYASVKAFEKAVLYRDKWTKTKSIEHAKDYLMLGMAQFRVGESGNGIDNQLILPLCSS